MTAETVASEVLTPAQVADYLHIDRDKVYRLLNSGELPGRKVGPGAWRIPKWRLDAWLENPDA